MVWLVEPSTEEIDGIQWIRDVSVPDVLADRLIETSRSKKSAVS